MKKVLSIVLTIALIVSIIPMGLFSITTSASSGNTVDFAGGSGSEADPYLIATKEHLNNVRKYLDAHYKMIADIVFTDADFTEGGAFYNNGQGWTPIGKDQDNAFCGVFDGNNFTIKNLTNNLVYKKENVSGSNRIYSTYVGLFGYNKGTLHNLTVSNAKIGMQLNSIRNNFVWGFAGIICAANEGIIIDCSVSGKVRVTENYIIEQTMYTEIDSDVGGITGRNIGIISKCNSKALVIGHSAGGIVGGENSQGSKIDSCYNLGIVSGSYSASGICGGVNYGEITKCYNSGVIDGNYFVSGIATSNGSLIENNFNCGELVGGSFVGGILYHWNTGNINYCYNVGNINSTDYFGGIIFPSENSESGTVLNSYYLDNIPEEVGGGRKEGTRCSYEQMQNKDSYENFDFSSVWEFDENAGYIFPTLRNVEYTNVDISIFETTDGIGTWWDPYKIRTKYDLDAIRNDLSACYKLVNNIYFEQSDFAEGGSFYNNGQGWNPMGENEDNAFTGVFDGNGFNIENLYINLSLDSDAYIGLFGYSKGEINNLGVLATNYVVDASKKNAYVGGIVGCSESNISNCRAEGKISVESTSSTNNEVVAGGIAGIISGYKSIIIVDCINDCDIMIVRNITSTATSGGIATTSAGGVIGKTTSDITLSKCNNTGNIYTTYYGGKLVDIVSGGIVGTSWFNTSIFENCYNCGNITAYSPDATNNINNHAGGIAGDAYSLKITKCYNTGNISSNHDSGGIFANTTSSVESEITDCFNVGNISSGFSSGGIGGSTEATITNCYNVGFVEGKIYGGIVGFNNGGNATVTNCFYWDIVDKGVGNWDDKAVKCSLSELKKSDTYQGFDFENDWSQLSNSNYAFPVLQGIGFVLQKEFTAIKIKTLPTKLKYLEFKDVLDVSGGEIDLFYNNGDVDSVILKSNMVTGFNNTKVGTQTLTITYEGKSCNYDVEIIAKSLVSISITTKPNKQTYIEGERFETAGLVVEAHYNNDTNSVITDYTISGYSSSLGTKTITVSYEGKVATFTVEVKHWDHIFDNNVDTICNTCGAAAYPGGNTLIKEGNTWYHVVNREKVTDTTLVNYNGVWYYVNKGVVDFSSNTLCKYNGVWYHVNGGKWVKDTTLVQYNGTWFYVKNGQVDFKSNTLVQYNGTWFHVNGGKWVKDTTIVNYKTVWYYVKNGVVDFKATTLCQYNGVWYYVKDGRMNTSNTLVKYNNVWYHVNFGKWVQDTTLVNYGGTWYYVNGGKMNTSNTLVQYNGVWYHVNGGKWVKDTTLVKYNGVWYYVSGGKVNFNYTGTVKYSGKTYKVVKGKMA